MAHATAFTGLATAAMLTLSLSPSADASPASKPSSHAPAARREAPAGASRHAVPAAVRRRARKLFFKGIRAFAQQRYPDALAHFLASYRLVPKNVVLYNIGMCYRALYRYTAAIRTFTRYLQRKGKRLPPGRRFRIKRMIAAMERRTGKVALTVDPPGAEIRVDGRPVGRAPLPTPVTVDPGQRELVLSHPDRQTTTLQLTVTSGETVRLRVRLSPLPGNGALRLSCSAPGCRARVDNQPAVPLPRRLTLPAGRHRIRVMAPGYVDQTAWIHIRPGTTAHRTFRLLPGPSSLGPRRARRWLRSWWFWTIVSAAVVAGATATGLAVWSTRHTEPAADLTWHLR